MRADQVEIAEDWLQQALANEEKWGAQDLDTLLLATQEELGELTQAYLEFTALDAEPEAIEEELLDLAALMYQLHWAIHGGRPNPLSFEAAGVESR